MSKGGVSQPFWVVLPYNPENIQSGPTRGMHTLYLQNRQALPDGVVERLRVGLPLYYSRPEAFEEAKKMAMRSRDTPVICEVVAFVELPQDLKFVLKSFNDDGETKAQEL